MAADFASILWSAAVDRDVLPVVAHANAEGQITFDLTAWTGRVALVADDDREHVVLRHGGGLLRFDVVAGTLRAGPVALAHCLPSPDGLEATLPALHTLSIVAALGPDAIPYTPDRRLDRLITALRVLDARAAGASFRDVAILLYGDRALAEWPGDGESMKSWVRRLVALSEALKRAGPRGVLAGAF